MTTTPPPRTARALTPPTPMHGPMHDSPRRSTRIHSQAKPQSDTPKTQRKRPVRPTSSQTLSPPSSPLVPQLHSHKSDEDPLSLFPSQRLAHPGTLPTPSKTPRKRTQHASSSTSRLLFPPSHNAAIDELMPTPKKSRTGKKNLALTLESFEADRNTQPNVEIYTDSKERVPEMDSNGDNPFVVKKNLHNAPADAKPTDCRGSRQRSSGLGQEIDDAVNNNEGMIFTFRGRKIYRPFTEIDELADDDQEGDADVAATESDELQHDTADQRMLRHMAGGAAKRRMLRSDVKPRLLFPLASEQDSVDDLAAEEAETDIENPEADASGQDEDEITAATPVKKRAAYTPITPPSTTHKKKKKSSPFDAWLRTKAALRRGGAKRPATEPAEPGNRTKRGRSSQPEAAPLA